MSQIIDRERVKNRSSMLLKAHWQMPAVFMIIAIVVACIPVVNLIVWPGLSYYFALLFIRCAPTGDFRLAKLDFKSREFIPILVVYVGWGVINAILLLMPFLMGMDMMFNDPIGGLLIILILGLSACGLSLYISYRFAPLFLLPFVVIETNGEMEVKQVIKVCFFRYSKVKGELFKFYIPSMICVFIGCFFLPAVFVIPFLIVLLYAHYYYSYLDLSTNTINSSDCSLDTDTEINSNINTDAKKKFKCCLKCGTKQSINSNFCDSCGNKFEEEKFKENILKSKEVSCEKCGTKNKDNAKFCISCGNKFGKDETTKLTLCPSCGKKNTEDSLFCIFCGNKLSSQE